MSETDPTTAAREWLAANPDHEVAVHVRAALDSAARYERLSVEMENAEPGGTLVVLLTPQGSQTIVTSPKRATEERLAEFLTKYFLLLNSVGNDLALNSIRERLQKRAATLAGRMAKKKLGTPEEAYARGALEEVTRIRGWVKGKKK